MAESGHCQNCRWWLLVDHLTITEDGRGEWGWCGRLRHEGALMSIGGGGLNRFMSVDTSPDFGCIQWEVRP